MVLVLTLAIGLLASVVSAQQAVTSPVTFAWDPVVEAQGYRLFIDGGTPTAWETAVTTPLVVPPGPHTATVTAWNMAGESPRSMPPVSFVVQPVTDPACVPPLGNRAVSIFVTALQKTGSGGALSRARLDFQLASPNSPVTRVAVRTNGGDLSAMAGTSLGELAGMWFTVPAVPGLYRLSVAAMNEYGCTTEVQTSKSVSVP